MRWWLTVLLMILPAVCGAEDALREVEIAQKQREIDLVSQDLWLRWRWGIVYWLPWLSGLALLAVLWKWGLARCPRCQRRFPKHVSGHTVRTPTSSSDGEAVARLRCRGCGEEWLTRRSISRRKN